MSEHFPTHDTFDSENALTIELSNDESFEMSPHNTALFEFTDDAASRNHIFFFTSTDEGNLESVYLFRTFDPETYDSIRKKIMSDTDYEITLATEVDPCEERAYQAQIDQHVAAWRSQFPDTVMDFIIDTSH